MRGKGEGGGAGHNSGCRTLCCKGLDPPACRIEPACRMHLQFGLFCIPTSGPQLVHQRLWYVMSRIWENAYERSVVVYWNE